MNTVSVQKEKRKHQRLKASLPVILFAETNNEPFKNIEYSDTEDISLGGVSILTKKDLSYINSSIQISFFIPSDDDDDEDAIKLIRTKGTIARIEKIKNSKEYKVGLEFTDIDCTHHSTLSSYIENRLKN